MSIELGRMVHEINVKLEYTIRDNCFLESYVTISSMMNYVRYHVQNIVCRIHSMKDFQIF